MELFFKIKDKEYKLNMGDGFVQIGDKELPYRIEKIPGTPLQALFIRNQIFVFSPLLSNKREVNLFFNGSREKVTLYISKKNRETSVRGGLIYSPMAGKVVKVMVKEGDEVKKGEGLFVLEAMKMQNEIESPFKGKVGKLSISLGSVVERGQELVRIQPS